MDDGEMSRASKGRMTELFANNRRVFDALGRKVTVYDWDQEVAPGVTAVGTPGHSIGHTSFVVTSGGKRLYVQSDVCNNARCSRRARTGTASSTRIAPQAAATRRRVYDMLVSREAAGAGLSLPVPGAGAHREARRRLPSCPSLRVGLRPPLPGGSLPIGTTWFR